MDTPEFEDWIRDAREGGLPVLASGLALLLSDGCPFWLAALMMSLLGIVLLLVGASVTFAASDPGQPDG